MSAPPSLDDLERQAPNHRTLGLWRPFRLGRKSVRGGEAHVPTQAGQCCFLCLQGKNFAQHAVRIPCFRSAETHRDDLLGGKKKTKTRTSDEITKSDSESDFSVYQKLVEACYQYQGKWKRWVPYFGPVDVREVTFEFTGTAEKNGRFAILIYPIIVDEVQEEANQTIAFASKYDNDHDRCSGNSHNIDCEGAMDAYHLPCMMIRYRNAWQRKKGLASLHQLRDCARDPRNANEFKSLDGLAQRSFILENNEVKAPLANETYDEMKEYPGIQIVLGWQWDRICAEIPLAVTYSWLGISIIWLFVIVWSKSTGNWQIATAVGQILVASLAILVFLLKD